MEVAGHRVRCKENLNFHLQQRNRLLDRDRMTKFLQVWIKNLINNLSLSRLELIPDTRPSLTEALSLDLTKGLSKQIMN